MAINYKKLNSFKRHITVLCLLIISIPTIIQSIHVFEEHDHFVCNASDEIHYHENETTDCSQLHFQFEVFTGNITIYFDTIPTHFYKNKFNEQSQITSIVHNSKIPSRGPPIV